MKLTQTFELGNKGYRCDSETLGAVRGAVKMYESTGVKKILDIAMGIGLATKRIVPMTDTENTACGL